MKTAALHILDSRTKIALSPGGWAALGGLGALGLGAGIGIPFAMGGDSGAGGAHDAMSGYEGTDSAGRHLFGADQHSPAQHYHSDSNVPAALRHPIDGSGGLHGAGATAAGLADSAGQILQDRSGLVGWGVGQATDSNLMGLAGNAGSQVIGRELQNQAGNIGNAVTSATDAYSKMITPAAELSPNGGLPAEYRDYHGTNWQGPIVSHADPRMALLHQALIDSGSPGLAARLMQNR
jgi:hypothetical protein